MIAFFHDTDEQMIPISATNEKSMRQMREREQRAHARAGQGRKNRDRMNVALVKDFEHDVAIRKSSLRETCFVQLGVLSPARAASMTSPCTISNMSRLHQRRLETRAQLARNAWRMSSRRSCWSAKMEWFASSMTSTCAEGIRSRATSADRGPSQTDSSAPTTNSTGIVSFESIVLAVRDRSRIADASAEPRHADEVLLDDATERTLRETCCGLWGVRRCDEPLGDGASRSNHVRVDRSRHPGRTSRQEHPCRTHQNESVHSIRSRHPVRSSQPRAVGVTEQRGVGDGQAVQDGVQPFNCFRPVSDDA